MRVEGDPYAQFIDPLEHWLKANGVDWDQVTAWPRIEIGQLQTLHVEMFHRDSDGDATIHRGGEGRVYTRMHEFPLTVAPDPEFWAAYQHSRPLAVRREELRQLAHDLRFPDVEHSQVTVVIPDPGDTFMVVTAAPIDDTHAADVVRRVEELLPGVKVAVMGGFETVMHQKAPRPERRL